MDWRGQPGLLVGSGIFSGKAGQGAVAGGSNPSVTLWDVHARWTPGKWDLAAVYARGHIGGTAALNTVFAGDLTPIPASFDGGYLQAAYNIWADRDYRLTPFVRAERFNTARSYALLATGLGRANAPYVRVVTAGANFQFAPNVVLKGDVQRFASDKLKNRINLGLGWSF